MEDCRIVVEVEGHDRVHRCEAADLEARVVRYGDLVPCTNAFIDTRTPGSDAKENFTIIGPGVAENPELGDTLTVPIGLERSYRGADGAAELIVVRGTG